MNALDFLTPAGLVMEIGQSSFKVRTKDAGLEVPLERLENGRLANSSREKLTQSLQEFLRKHTSWPRQRPLCAIGARGVSLRRLVLPAPSKEEFHRLLLLQIESEFPLAPEDLAWGYLKVGPASVPPNGGAPVQEVIVIALKREGLEEYSEILSGCGLSPVFTLGGLARNALCSHSGSYGILDIGRTHSELISFENRAPTSIRILPWGGEDITRSIEKGLAISRDEAEKIKIDGNSASSSNGQLGPAIRSEILAELASLAQLINRNWGGQKLYLAGKSSRLTEIAPGLARALGRGVECQPIDLMTGDGRSAATVGLESYLEKNGGLPPLTLELTNTKGRQSNPSAGPWKLAALACLLAVVLFSFRYAEAVLWKPRLSRKLSEIKGYRDSFPKIDRQLSFLRYLETNQAPFLDTLLTTANAATPGTRVDSFSLNRRGELSLRATMQIPQAAEFRSKLIESGFFSTVVVEEQTPSPDRQKVVVRITALVKPPASRPPVPASVSPVRGLTGEKGTPAARPTAVEAGRPPTPRQEMKR